MWCTETGNQGDFIGRADRRSSENVRGNDPKCEGPTNGVSQEVTALTFTGIRAVQKHLLTCCEKAKLHAYRISVVHELNEPDQVKRVAYCRWFQTLLKENPGILDYTWFSDEAWFYLS